MHNRRKRNFHWLNVSIRSFVVLMMILSAFLPTGAARASELPASSASEAAAGVLAAPLLDENFSYGGTAGSLTAVSGGNWVAHSGIGTNPIQYATTSLSMPSYVSSAIGGSATFSSAGGEDVNRTFASQSTGTLYLAALVNLSSAATGDYFLHLKDTGTSNLRARVYAQIASGQLRFGLFPSSGTPTYSNTNFALSTTYLVVVKYNVDNLDSALYVLDTCTSTEPGTPLLFIGGSGTSVAISSVAIRQGGAASSPAGTVDGIRVATNWADAVTCVAPALSMTKSANPDTNVPYQGEITYTVTLTNSSVADIPNVLFTDTLPAEVDFASWINQPTGAVVSADEITWNGNLTANTAISFAFIVDHGGNYGDVVTNTAEYNGTTAGTAEAVFTVEELTSDVTFVYHDFEDVVRTGDALYLAGDFNSWSTTATPMTGDANGEVFTATVTGLVPSNTYEYIYVVNSGGDQWDWLQDPGAGNRSITVAGDATVDDYRNVTVDWAILQSPSTLTVDAYQPTDPVYGRTYIENVTNPAGEGRGIKAEVGYGSTATPADWTWFPMTYNVDDGNNDEFMGTMTPTAGGVYSYTVRFDGNWGTGNPNAAWTYGDLDGYVPGGDPFELSQTGVMTSTLYDIGIAKTCPPSPVDPGQTMSYILTYTVADAAVDGVVITDVLPADVTYVADSSGVTPAQPVAGTLVWNLGTVATSGSFVVTGTLSSSPIEYNLVNEAQVDATNDTLSGNNSASCSNTRTGPISIYNIQYTTVPGTGNTYPSPFVNLEVTTTGTVCAVLGNYIFIAEAPGAWHGLLIYYSANPKPVIGNEVEVNGTITEYYGMTEYSNPSITTLGPGNPVCVFTPVDGSIVPDNNTVSEPYESVLVQYQNLTISSTSDSRGMDFNDAGGPGNWGTNGYTPSPKPAAGTQYEFVRGPINYTFNLYRVNPPTSADAVLLDITPPTVVSTDPVTGTTGVNPYKPIYATFSEEIDPATLNNITFILSEPGGDVMGTVGYDAATFIASFTPDGALAANTTYTATLTTGIKDLPGNALAANYIWSFTTGELDTTPPSIISQFPAPGALDAPLGANVVITFSEELNPETLIEANFELLGPYGLMPWDGLSYDSGLFEVTLNPSGLLLPTTLYTVTVSGDVTDWAGLSVPADQRTWTFTTQTEPPMYAYHGDLHNHTSYSDGSGTPAEAFATGYANGLDFMAITDHSYAINDTEWADILAQAEVYNDDGEFVTLRGFEYTQGGEGHANVYNTVRHATRTNVSGCSYCDYTPNLEAGSSVQGFYNWLAITGTIALDGNGTIMQFNHPGWINFNDWAYHPEVEDVAQLEEVGNGWGSSYVFSWDEFIRSLDYGWQVGATNNTDNHNTDWGNIGPNRTGVVVADLTREDLMEALNARRTFATEDMNAELFFKANGYWMGSEIPNTGSIAFHAWGSDPDGELITRVDLVTAGGQVVASIEPNTSDFDWLLTETIEPGVHYYLILVTQADGDRIVSSPVWTQGVEDVRITDLTIQPSLPTIYNPSLLSARVTNRGASAQTLTVNFDANGVLIGTTNVTVSPCTSGPCDDGYATISWQPVVTGPVTITVSLEGAPAGDNPDDNSRSLRLDVTDQNIPLILIDTGHNNIGVDQQGISKFVADMTLHGYNILFNLDEITASDLNTDTVKLLILNAYGPNQLAANEMQAIADYVAAGGNLWMNGISDYNSQVYWLHNVSNRLNALIAAIEVSAGQQIPVRFNDDEVLDGNNNNGYPWGVLWHNFPVSDTTGVGMNVARIQSWSDCSLIDRNGVALTVDDLGANGFMMVLGDEDTGSGTYGEPNRTHNTDAEVPGYPTNDAYIYTAGNTVPGGAGYDLTGDAGRIMFYTDSNDVYNTFAYVSGDGKQNELFNLETVMWLLGEPLQKSTIAEARAESAPNQPDNLDRLVWVEGEITAAYGEFFNVLYVQDATGGITVHAPAGDIDPTVYTRGTMVRVVGTVGIYNGDTEIEFFEAEMVQVIGPSTGEPEPLPMSTNQASLEENQGWLSVITGTVMSKIGSDTLFVDDGSGPVRIFLDGYNGDFNDIQVNDLVRVTGLISEDGDGPRIRVRNYGMHPEYPDDVVVLPQVLALEITKSVVTSAEIIPGSLVTYTLVLSNTGDGMVLETVLTDTLPAGVTFGGFVVDGGAVQQDGTVSWTGNVDVSVDVMVIFTATVNLDYSLYGTTITNTVEYDTSYDGSGSAEARFTVIGAPVVTIAKSVAVPGTLNLGDIVTYTLTLHNSGEAAALNLAMTDTLQAGVTFGTWVQQNGAVVTDGVITWNGSLSGENVIIFTATVDMDPMLYGQTINNTVKFTSDNAGTGLAEAAFDVGTPELSIAKTVETAHVPAQPGDPITYTIVVRNDGAIDGVDVNITDVLQDDVIGSDVNITVTIQAGMAYTITIPGTLSPEVALGFTVINTASYENGALNGEATASFIVWGGEAILSITKTVETAHVPAQPGDPITYTIVVRNVGTAEAVDVHIWDELPVSIIGDDLNITVTIQAGAEYKITIAGTLSPDAVRGTKVDNTAYYECGALNGEATASFNVATLIKLYLPNIMKY